MFAFVYLCHQRRYLSHTVFSHTPEVSSGYDKFLYFGKTIKLVCHAHTMFFFVCEIKHYVVVRWNRMCCSLLNVNSGCLTHRQFIKK